MCESRGRAIASLKRELSATNDRQLFALLAVRCEPFVQGALWHWGTMVFRIAPDECHDWVTKNMHLSDVCAFHLLRENCDCEKDMKRMKRQTPCAVEHKISGWEPEEPLDEFLIVALLNAPFKNIRENARRSLGRLAARSANSRKGMLARLADNDGQLMEAIHVAKCGACTEDITIDNRCGCATNDSPSAVEIRTRFCREGAYREVFMYRCKRCDTLFFPISEQSPRCPYCERRPTTKKKRHVWIPGHVIFSDLPPNADDHDSQFGDSASIPHESERRAKIAEALDAWPKAREQFLADVASNNKLRDREKKIQRLREVFEHIEQALVLVGNPARDDEAVILTSISEIWEELGNATKNRTERFLNRFLIEHGIEATIRF